MVAAVAHRMLGHEPIVWLAGDVLNGVPVSVRGVLSAVCSGAWLWQCLWRWWLDVASG